MTKSPTLISKNNKKLSQKRRLQIKANCQDKLKQVTLNNE